MKNFVNTSILFGYFSAKLVKVKIVAIIQTKKSSNAHKGLSEKNRRQPPYHQKIIDNCTSPCTVDSLFGKMQTQYYHVKEY